MKFIKLLASVLLTMFLVVGCASMAGSAPKQDADGSYTSVVLDTSHSLGTLTAHYLCTTGSKETSNDVSYAGDCTVFTSPEGLVMMVDCSNSWCFEEIDSQLKAMGIDRIDVFVMSHPHADHIGSFVELASRYDIGRVYKNAHEYESATYGNAMAKIKELDIPCDIVYEGDSFMLGDHVKIAVYGPEKGSEEDIKAGYMDANDCSLAMKITYGDSSFWTSGDIYITQELALVEKYGQELDSDIVKMNHHGYETSNRNEYIEALSPLVAIQQHSLITSKTVAMKYRYKHGALTFYTSQDGTVSVSTPGDGTYEIQSQYIRQITNIYGEATESGHYSIGRD
ncbi:MAG: MBL fold metallo-hydrolase [Sphaerochaetaceae bacterium]|nr:MBL fold metallo-hydrolase [uncultured Sphaerochaeta sp.]MDC7228748.1 MBL fold metallo-hydrolase [Sphaerochaetaceae bacterium]